MVIPAPFPPRQSKHTVVEVNATGSESSGIPDTIDDAHTWPTVGFMAVPFLVNESISVSSSKSSRVSEPVDHAGTSPIVTTTPFLAPVITSNVVTDSPSPGIPEAVEPDCTVMYSITCVGPTYSWQNLRAPSTLLIPSFILWLMG
jgi:hypothetical protein